MATRRVRTGAGYVPVTGGPAQWQVTYEDQVFTGAYVAVPSQAAQWQYPDSGVAVGGITDEAGVQVTDESGASIVDE